jgi:hypothetical protein
MSTQSLILGELLWEALSCTGLNGQYNNISPPFQTPRPSLLARPDIHRETSTSVKLGLQNTGP